MDKPTAKTNVRIIVDEQGKWFYPATQRSDGTWRNPIAIREGHVPAELQEKYVCRGKREATGMAQRSVQGTGTEIQQDERPVEMHLKKETRGEHCGAKEEDRNTTDWKDSAKAKPKGSAMPVMSFFLDHLVPDTDSSLGTSKDSGSTSMGYDNMTSADFYSKEKDFGFLGLLSSTAVTKVELEDHGQSSKTRAAENVFKDTRPLFKTRASEEVFKDIGPSSKTCAAEVVFEDIPPSSRSPEAINASIRVKTVKYLQAQLPKIESPPLSIDLVDFGKNKEKELLSALELLEQEKQTDLEDFKRMINSGSLAEKEWVQCWNDIANKWNLIKTYENEKHMDDKDLVELARSLKISYS